MFKRYSNGSKGEDGSWAVITGGSDGIGLAMCKNLARQGYNICIVARNEQKMQEKLNEIWKECRSNDRNFKTMYIVADFVKLKTIEEYKSVIGTKLQKLDIGVLALNAGYAEMGPFHMIDDIEVEKICQVNAVHVWYLLKVMIK